VKVSDVTLTLFAWTDIPSTQYSRSRSTTLRAIGAMDVALWDVAGKVSGLPIHRLLGVSRDRVRACASSAVLASKQEYAQEASRFKAQGWTAYERCTRSTIRVWTPRSILILSSGGKSRFSADGEWRAPDVQRLKGKNLRGFNGDHR
jgi:Mandelate racemase / muconate lactonizing enzyme, N-terminal domain